MSMTHICSIGRVLGQNMTKIRENAFFCLYKKELYSLSATIRKALENYENEKLKGVYVNYNMFTQSDDNCKG